MSNSAHPSLSLSLSLFLSVIDVAIHDLIMNLPSLSSRLTLLLEKNETDTGSSGRRVRVKKVDKKI
jgi:hypothetical protein